MIGKIHNGFHNGFLRGMLESLAPTRAGGGGGLCLRACFFYFYCVFTVFTVFSPIKTGVSSVSGLLCFTVFLVCFTVFGLCFGVRLDQ